MGIATLVRHGQASFGAADYDQLSDLGRRQCERLGQYFKLHGQGFDAVFIGSLRRHRQSLDSIAQGMGDGAPLPVPQVLPGLDEYDPAALIRALHPGPLSPPDSAEAVRHHFRLLRDALLAWMAGQLRPAGMPDFKGFSEGVRQALALARKHHQGDVLVVSSGGPISVALGQVLGLAPEAVVALNLRLRNSALSELVASAQRHSLLSFNHLPHLATPDVADWLTYA